MHIVGREIAAGLQRGYTTPSSLMNSHYTMRGAEFLSEYLLLRALALVRARSLFVDLDDGLTPSAPV